MSFWDSINPFSGDFFVYKAIDTLIDVGKRILPYVVAAAAVVFTAGAALPEVAAAFGTWAGASSSLVGALGVTAESTLGTVLTSAITYAGYGAVGGGIGAALTGKDITKGIEMGAATGVVVGGITGGLSAYNSVPTEVTPGTSNGIASGDASTVGASETPLAGQVDGSITKPASSLESLANDAYTPLKIDATAGGTSPAALLPPDGLSSQSANGQANLTELERIAAWGKVFSPPVPWYQAPAVVAGGLSAVGPVITSLATAKDPGADQVATDQARNQQIQANYAGITPVTTGQGYATPTMTAQTYGLPTQNQQSVMQGQLTQPSGGMAAPGPTVASGPRMVPRWDGTKYVFVST